MASGVFANTEVDTSERLIHTGNFEEMLDSADEPHWDNLKFEWRTHGTIVAGREDLAGGGYLADKVVGIGSTVAFAAECTVVELGIEPMLVSQGYAVDDIGDIQAGIGALVLVDTLEEMRWGD